MTVLTAAQALAQAPVEERLPARDATGSAQRRVEFARQALARAQAQVRDASAEHQDAQGRFDEAKARLDKTAANLARARAQSARAKKRYDAQAAELERQQAGGGR